MGSCRPACGCSRSEKLQRGPDRAFTGSAVLAFYRPGKRQVPAFGLPWVQIVTGHRGVMSHDPAEIEVTSVLPGGNPSLRDIREPEAPASLAPLWAVLGRWLRGRRSPGWWPGGAGAKRDRGAGADRAAAASSAPPDPYTVALARLDAIDSGALGRATARWSGTTRRWPHVLREYLETAEGIPAPGADHDRAAVVAAAASRGGRPSPAGAGRPGRRPTS